MVQDFLDLQYRFFVVDERPVCLWDVDIQKRALEFLESIDPAYFEYIANTHTKNIVDDGEIVTTQEAQHAALAIRMAYSQALETFFALLCAAIQAPSCVHAWINAYKNHELSNLVDKIHHHKPILSRLDAQILSWSSVSKCLLAWLVLEDKEKESAVKAGFSRLWSRFASDFLDAEFNEEYNSIKHGLRISPGGFDLAIGVEDQPGVPAPREKMRLLGSSKFGSSYFASGKIGQQSHHRYLNRHHRNWSPEDMVYGLHMASMSIENLLSALKILNGVPAEGAKFTWPTDVSTFGEPWKRSTQLGVKSMQAFDVVIEPEFIINFSKENILAGYKTGEDAGGHRLIFGDTPSSTEAQLSN